MTPRTRDGFLWTPQGTSFGLETDAVVPNRKQKHDKYDVTVIGAGFTGLVAARELSAQGLKVLILEGRDRIGGRAWTAKVDEEYFEMGGSWIHWHQTSIWNELIRYRLDEEILPSTGTVAPKRAIYSAAIGKPESLNFQHIQHVADAFFGIDGQTSRTLMPYPYNPNRRPCLVDTTQCSFTHVLEWYAIGGHTLQGLDEVTTWYKIGSGGMTKLARLILDDYKGDILLNTIVDEIQYDGPTAVITSSGSSEEQKRFESSGIISTLPLNCLKSVKLRPRIPDLENDLIQTGHPNRGWKLHMKSPQPEDSWQHLLKSSSRQPWVAAIQDHNTDHASFSIAFGLADHLPNPTVRPEEVVREYEKHIAPHNSPIHIQAMLTHDWVNDPFSRGTWMVTRPKQRQYCLETMQQVYGNGRLVFASSDWAQRGYSFVDGAIDEGKRAAKSIDNLFTKKN